MIQLVPFKLKIKKDFLLICQTVWKAVKCQGKIREKSRNLEVAVKWQPWECAAMDSVLSFLGNIVMRIRKKKMGTYLHVVAFLANKLNNGYYLTSLSYL